MAIDTNITPGMITDLIQDQIDELNDITSSTATTMVSAVDAVDTVAAAVPSVSVSSSGLITATSTQGKGYVAAATTNKATKQLTTKAGTTITPSTATQTAVSSGMYTTGDVKVAPIPNQRTSANVTVSGKDVTTAAGYYSASVTKSVATVARANTTLSGTATNNTIVYTAANNQGTGYVTGANKTATKTVSTSVSGNTVTVTDGAATISAAVATVTRASTTISTTADDTADTLTIAAGNNQGTGYVTGANKTANKVVTLSVGTPAIDSNGDVTAIATAQDNSSTPVKVSQTSSKLSLGKGSLSVIGNTVTASKGYYSAQTSKSVATVSRATTSMTSTVSGGKLVINASNNQGTGYVTGSNATASKTVSLSVSGKTVTASDGANSISSSVATVARANTTLSSTATNNTLVFTAGNNQGTGYVTGSNSTTSKTVSISASGKKVTASDGTNSISANVADGAYSAGVSLTPGYGHASADSNIPLSAPTTTQPTSGYYIKVEGSGDVSGKGEAIINTAGYIATGSKTSNSSSVTSNTATAYYSIPAGEVSVTGGELVKSTGNVSATGTNITLVEQTTQPTSGPYITTKGSGAVTRKNIKYSHLRGYIEDKASTVVNEVATETSNEATKYYTIATETRTVTPTEETQTLNPSSNKLISKVTINPIPSEYKDTSSGDALASDIIKGKKAWVDGKEVTGSIVEYDSSVPFEGTYWNDEQEDNHIFWTLLSEKIAIENEIDLAIPKSDFGDVSSDYVPQGYTFTSSEGVDIGGKAPIYDTRPITIDPTGLSYDGESMYYGTVDILDEYYFNDEEYQNALFNEEVSRNFLVENGNVSIAMPADKFGNVSPAYVHESYTFTSESGIKQQGTMKNNGSVTKALTAGGSYTIPAGYHNGSGKVTANSLSSQTSGTAAASHILKDKTAWVNGSKITGTVVERGDANLTHVATSGTITVTASPGMYTGGASYSFTDNNLTAANIKSGTTIFGVEGTFTNISSNGASAAHILKDKKAYVNGALVTGTLATYSGATSITPSKTAQQFETSGKYLSGKLTVQAIPAQYIDTTISTDAAAAGSILSGKKAYVNGNLVTGSIPSRGDSNITKAITAGQITVQAASGHYPSNSSITFTDTYLTAANIRSGTTIFGVEGTFTNIASNGAAPSDIKSGQKAYVNGSLVTGTLSTYSGSTSITPSTATQTFSTSGKYVGSNLTVTPIPSQYKDTTISSGGATAAQILKDKKAYVNGSLITGTLATYSGATSITPSKTAQQFETAARYVGSKLTVQAIPDTYVDTSSGDAVASNLTVGKKAWVDGVEITGTLPIYDYTAIDVSDDGETESKFIFSGSVSTERIVEDDIYVQIDREAFGDAYADSVSVDCTFTSAQGIAIQGTLPYYDGTPLVMSHSSSDSTNHVFRAGVDTRSMIEDEVYTSMPKANFGNAAAANVLSGKTFTSSAGVKINGSMTNRGAYDIALSATQTAVAIPAGYHNGSGAAYALTEDRSVTPTTSAQEITAQAGYFLGKVTVAGDTDLVASNIKKDVSIFGVTGTYEGSGGGATLGKCTVTLDLNTFKAFGGNAQVVGYTIVDGSQIQTVYQSVQNTSTITLSNVLCGSCITVYHNIPGLVTSNSSNIAVLLEQGNCTVIKAPTTNGATGSVVFLEDT